VSDLSLFRPSGAKRWLPCPGSVILEALAPDSESTIFAREGSACHLLSEMIAKGVMTHTELTRSQGKLIREIAPLLDPLEHDYLDIRIDEEMIWAAQVFILFVKKQLPPNVSLLECDKVLIEHPIRLSRDVDGTLDIAISDWPVTLHVIDLKYGAGLQVEAINNPQLAIYGLGALRHFGDDFETVKMSIFQPRGVGETVRTWEVETRELKELWLPRITKAVERAKTHKYEYNPGEHCKWCKGAINCPRAEEICGEIMVEPILPVPYTVEELERVLSSEAIILEHINQCKARATELIIKGQNVAGFKLVQTWGREKWLPHKQKDVRKLLDLIGAESHEYQNVSLRTPKQVRTELGGRYPKQLDEFTVTPMQGVRLVPSTDPRRAFVPAAEVFKTTPLLPEKQLKCLAAKGLFNGL